MHVGGEAGVTDQERLRGGERTADLARIGQEHRHPHDGDQREQAAHGPERRELSARRVEPAIEALGERRGQAGQRGHEDRPGDHAQHGHRGDGDAVEDAEGTGDGDRDARG